MVTDRGILSPSSRYEKGNKMRIWHLVCESEICVSGKVSVGYFLNIQNAEIIKNNRESHGQVCYLNAIDTIDDYQE